MQKWAEVVTGWQGEEHRVGALRRPSTYLAVCLLAHYASFGLYKLARLH